MGHDTQLVEILRAAVAQDTDKSFTAEDIRVLLTEIDYLTEQNQAEVAHASELRRQLAAA